MPGAMRKDLLGWKTLWLEDTVKSSRLEPPNESFSLGLADESVP